MSHSYWNVTKDMNAPWYVKFLINLPYYFLGLIAVMTAVILGGVAYEESQKEWSSNRAELAELGLLQEHELRFITLGDSIDGMVAGGFFLASGSIKGEVRTIERLQFYWGRTEDETIFTTLPYELFSFVHDDSAEVPMATFIYDKEWLVNRTRPFSQAEQAHPNRWLSGEGRKHLVSIVVRISEEDKEKYVDKLL